MYEMFFKYLLVTRSKYGSYSHTHKLHKLLEELIEYTDFRTDKSKYRMALQVITVCAEEYRYNFLIDCDGYRESVQIADDLLSPFGKVPPPSLDGSFSMLQYSDERIQTWFSYDIFDSSTYSLGHIVRKY